jgi:hypothetical protein
MILMKIMMKKKIYLEQQFKMKQKFVLFVSKNGLIPGIIDLSPLNVVIYLAKGLFRIKGNKTKRYLNCSCIEKWLRGSSKCPQCQSTVKKKDLRRIYCRALHVLDTSERDNAIRERDLEKKARKKIAYEKAELQLAYDIIKDQLKRLQNDHERLLK